jgi:LysR family transcriptional regulator, benzoate and cis,cis-muconate-responsive activator of ben and cat genes
MEITLLRYFQAVADELNMTKAATRLGIAQPPLSRQIRHLEEEVGVLLFDRVGRNGLRLTEPGRFLLEQSKLITLGLADAINGARRIARSGKRWFSVGYVPSVLSDRVITLVRELQAHDPLTEIGLCELHTLQQVDALVEGRVDLSFGRVILNDPTVECKILGFEPLVAAFPSAMPSVPSGPIPVSALATYPFILYAAGTGDYIDLVLPRMAKQGLSPRVVTETSDLWTALSLVEAGVGMTIIPASAVQDRAQNIRYAQVESVDLATPVVMTYRSKDPSPFLAYVIGLAIVQHDANYKKAEPGGSHWQ